MKSSFSWPGRPPAEMISRNVKRLLTSILDGTLKRGAFCTSTLDGTPKRGAFGTSILDGTPKRGAFCTSILDGALKRDAFFGRQGRGVSNTPSKRSRMGTRVAKGSQTRDSLSPAGPFDGAYAIRPYDRTPKEGAFYTSYLVGTPKPGTFCTSYLVATLKRGAFCTSYLVATLKRGAFCTSYLVGSLRRGVFCLFYSSFLALMQEKKQKKIKASAEGGEVCRVHDRWSRDLLRVCLLFFDCCF